MNNADKPMHEEKLNIKKVRLMNVISFLLGFSAAITAYILSSYFKEVKGADNVSVFYLIAYVVILTTLLNYHKLIRRFGKSFVFIASLFLLAITAWLISLFPVSSGGLYLVIIYIVLYSLCFVGKDIVLESFSTDQMSGRIRGAHLTIMNLGFIFGPLIAAKILDKFNYQGVFLLEFVIISAVFLIAFIHLRKINHKFKPVVTVDGLFKKVFKRKNILRIYYISFLLEFFYFIAVAYTPIYLLNLGFDWRQIGVIFTIMLLPFVFIQYPVGRLADKKMGEKELLIFGLFLLSLTTLNLYFIESVNLMIWAAALFLTRIGAALVEILRDSYFYKMVDSTDVDIIDFYRTAESMGYLIASIFSAILLVYLPLKNIFVVLAIIIFTGIYPAVKLKDTLSEKELKTAKKNV